MDQYKTFLIFMLLLVKFSYNNFMYKIPITHFNTDNELSGDNIITGRQILQAHCQFDRKLFHLFIIFLFIWINQIL